MNIKEKHNRKLLVEGNDDQHVVWALCEKHTVKENFDVIDCEGINKLKQQIPVRIKQSGVDVIGIIIDADRNASNNYNTVKTILASSGFSLPVTIPSDGLIHKEKGKTIGVWVMPDNSSSGMLEDFIKSMIPSGDDLLPVANSTLADMETKKINRYALVHKPKALIHTWLAWQDSPGSPMGSGIARKYLTDSLQCQKFVAWLEVVFA